MCTVDASLWIDQPLLTSFAGPDQKSVTLILREPFIYGRYDARDHASSSECLICSAGFSGGHVE